MKRKLTTVLGTDLVGYCRPVAFDEEGTIAAPRDLLATVIDPILATHEGQTFKTMGDGFFAEFLSPVAAPRGALARQGQLADRNVSKDIQPLPYRIGIRLGDVALDGDDGLGDAVNVAARLEGIALECGIAMTRAAVEQAQGRVSADMIPIDPQSLENPPAPLDVWPRRGAGGSAPPGQAEATATRPRLLISEFAWTGEASDLNRPGARGRGRCGWGLGPRRDRVAPRIPPTQCGTLGTARAARDSHLLEGSVAGRAHGFGCRPLRVRSTPARFPGLDALTAPWKMSSISKIDSRSPWPAKRVPSSREKPLA